MPKIFRVEGVEAGKVIVLATHHKSTETGMLKVAVLRIWKAHKVNCEEGTIVKHSRAVFLLLVCNMEPRAPRSYTIRALISHEFSISH